MHSPVEGYLGCLGIIMNKVAINICIFLCKHDFIFLALKARRGTSGSHGKYRFDFIISSYHSLLIGFLLILFFPLLLSNLFLVYKSHLLTVICRSEGRGHTTLPQWQDFQKLASRMINIKVFFFLKNFIIFILILRYT